jgi:heme/copper-type cytochrome/quinol oxidase subunit 3
MQALPAAPAPPPRRQVFVGTALAGVAMLMITGGMLGIWILMRERAFEADGTWVPKGITIPEVASNVMLIGVLALPLFAQWAHYAARRGERGHTGLALGVVALFTIAIINAQAFIYAAMAMSIDEGGYPGMFYAVTGLTLTLFLFGLGFTAITAFRFLGGRTSDQELVAAHALYWYVMAVVFAAVWLIVYVTK